MCATRLWLNFPCARISGGMASQGGLEERCLGQLLNSKPIKCQLIPNSRQHPPEISTALFSWPPYLLSQTCVKHYPWEWGFLRSPCIMHIRHSVSGSVHEEGKRSRQYCVFKLLLPVYRVQDKEKRKLKFMLMLSPLKHYKKDAVYATFPHCTLATATATAPDTGHHLGSGSPHQTAKACHSYPRAPQDKETLGNHHSLYMR